MKKLLSSIIVLCILVSCTIGIADTLTIDTETATNDEIEAAITLLQQVKIDRAKKAIPPAGPAEDGSILFRSVPWYSTRAETEAIIGMTSSSKGPTDIYRIGAIDSEYVTFGRDRVDDLGGCRAYYRDVTVAGLEPSTTYICYIYPIVDGIIIRDDSESQIYFAYHTYSTGDFGDYKSIYSELRRKLDSVYGTGKETKNEYFTRTKWTDPSGNYIQLTINDDNDYVTLSYIAASADKRLDEMQKAIDAEKAAEEEQKLQMNQDNYDGL